MKSHYQFSSVQYLNTDLKSTYGIFIGFCKIFVLSLQYNLIDF